MLDTYLNQILLEFESFLLSGSTNRPFITKLSNQNIFNKTEVTPSDGDFVIVRTHYFKEHIIKVDYSNIKTFSLSIIEFYRRFLLSLKLHQKFSIYFRKSNLGNIYFYIDESPNIIFNKSSTHVYLPNSFFKEGIIDSYINSINSYSGPNHFEQLFNNILNNMPLEIGQYKIYPEHFTINSLPNTTSVVVDELCLLVHNSLELSLLLTNNKLVK